MRTITVLCMALVLFSALGARLRDSKETADAATITETPTVTVTVTASNETTSMTTTTTTASDATTQDATTSTVTASNETTATITTTSSDAVVPTSVDVVNFLSGVWEAIGLGHDFDDFNTCIQLGKNAGTQLQKAMTQMNGSSASQVNKGLNRLDKVVNHLVHGLRACKMTDKYTKTIYQVINKFTDAENITIQTGSSISLDGIEVYPDVSAAIAACDEGSYANCGLYVGNAMGKVFYASQNVTSADKVAEINSTPDITWEAAEFPQFKTMTLWKFKKRRITLRRQNKDLETSTESPAEEQTRRNLATIPTTFDSRTRWPGCIHAIRDQGNCGSCWAFSASEVLSDRFCIVSNKSVNTVMSPQYLVSCDTNELACNGGYLDLAWKFLENTGDVTDSCWPYQSGNGAVPTCGSFTRCADNSRMRKYYAKRNSTKVFTTPAAIQQEIMTNGPVEGAMDVFSDFMSYRTGIYSPTAGATYAGGHAIKIVGWGNSNGINYWIVANSWGTYWGESGFFRIRFGACNIDKGAYAGIPDLTRS